MDFRLKLLAGTLAFAATAVSHAADPIKIGVAGPYTGGSSSMGVSMRDGVRRVTQLSEVVGLEGDVVIMNDVFAFEYEGEAADGTVRGGYRTSRARPAFSDRLSYFGLEQAWMDALEAPG